MKRATARKPVGCIAGLATGVVLTILGQVALVHAAVPRSDDAKTVVGPRVPIRVYAFPLGDVRLLDGPFKDAMQRDADYLLRLEPDRLLHRYRLYAGLKPKGDIYGGWETMGISGHSLGHYLSACSMTYASTGDDRFRDRVAYIVEELATCQKANGNGYVGGVQDGKRVFAEVAAGDIRSKGFDLNGIWVPWYTQHKLFAGLFDAHRYCGNAKALAVARKLGDWACDVTATLTEEQFQTMLACEHGGMNESLTELYALTGDEKYLELSRRFHHKAVLDPMKRLESQGYEVTWLPVDGKGHIDLQQLEQAITDKTILASLMAANNEIGTLHPIAEIGAIAKEKGVLFHTDATQAAGKIPLDVVEQKVDLLSLSAHKFYGPKGVGILYARRGVPFLPTQTGGSHERKRRAGTENVAYIVGLATALRLAYEELEESNVRITRLRDKLISGVLERIPDSQLSGHPTQRLPNNASFLFKYIEGESILLNLDLMGVAASSGSACTSGSLEPSHVLTAMGFAHEVAHGSLRLSLGKDNTDQDIDHVLEILPGIIEKLRKMSPLYSG